MWKYLLFGPQSPKKGLQNISLYFGAQLQLLLCGGSPSAKPTGPILFEFAENLYFTPDRCSQDGILTDVLNQPTFRPKFGRSCYVNFFENRVLVLFRAAQISKSGVRGVGLRSNLNEYFEGKKWKSVPRLGNVRKESFVFESYLFRLCRLSLNRLASKDA